MGASEVEIYIIQNQQTQFYFFPFGGLGQSSPYTPPPRRPCGGVSVWNHAKCIVYAQMKRKSLSVVCSATLQHPDNFLPMFSAVKAPRSSPNPPHSSSKKVPGVLSAFAPVSPSLSVTLFRCVSPGSAPQEYSPGTPYHLLHLHPQPYRRVASFLSI